MDAISIVSGWFPIVVIVLAFAALLASIAWDRRAARRQLLFGIPFTAALVGIVAVVDDGLALVPYQFPNSYYLWVGLVALAVVWAVLGWRPRRWWRRAVSLLAVLFTALLAFTLVNENYQYYPTVGALRGAPAQNQVGESALQQAVDDFARTGTLPDHGFVVTATIPAPASQFVARPAFVWLPPAWVDTKRPLPVLELLSGSPGTPDDWLRAGNAQQTAETFAAQHDGLAPIIVMPYINGSVTADTECVDSAVGRAETYLTVDVPAFVRTTYAAAHGPGSLAVAGLSEGGMCSLMLTLRHPDLFTAFADFSGLSSPTVGEVVDRATTIAQMFGGSAAAYDAHDPLHLLATTAYPGVHGWFAVGASDPLPKAAEAELVPLARAAGIQVCVRDGPGAHDFDFWEGALRTALPWLASRLGLVPDAVGAAACTG